MAAAAVLAGLATAPQALHVHLMAKARPAAALDEVDAALQMLDAGFVVNWGGCGMVLHGSLLYLLPVGCAQHLAGFFICVRPFTPDSSITVH